MQDIKVSTVDTESAADYKDSISDPSPRELQEGDARLEELGYKHELKREYSTFSAFSFAVSISGLFSTLATTFSYPLISGGSASAVWCWAIAGFGCLCIGLSVAEVVSAYPTSGGMYYACSRVFPKRYAPLMCWLNGWLNLLGQIACVASTDYGAAQMLLAAVSMGSDFVYQPTAGHTVGTVAAILAFHGLVNCLPTKYIERVTRSYAILHYLCLFTGAIALLATTFPKNSATYVFTNVELDSGWKTGWGFVFGFISVSWSQTDYDAASHLAEELRRPEMSAPIAITAANIVTYVLGWLYNVVLCFCMGDPSSILNAQQPVAMIYYNSLGKGGGLTYSVLMFVVMNCVGICVLQSASRTMWAQARDHMYPFASKWLYRVNRFTVTPINAVFVTTVLCIAINLIALGSTETINAIFNVTAIAIDWSMCVPIVGKLLYPQLYKRGPWHLGKMSVPTNIYAVVWTLFASIVFFMPTQEPVTPQNMNYAVVFFVFILAAAAIVWVCGGNKFYKGPAAEAPDAKLITIMEGIGADVFNAEVIQRGEEK